MNSRTIKALLHDLKQAKALVVGDMILDEYLWGSTSRISPEAPVPVFNVARKELRLGGAGNVALNLSKLGCHVILASVVGKDQAGQDLRSLLDGSNINAYGLLDSPERRTSHKSRIIAQQQQMIRIDQEDCAPITREVENDLLEACRKNLPNVNVVLVSDYQKGVLTDSFLAQLIALCRAAELPVLADPKGRDFYRYKGATLLTPNRKELAIAVNHELADEATFCAQAQQLCQKLELESLIVTRSKEGMSLFRLHEAPQHLPTVAREVYDVSGAGDTVFATLGAAFAVGQDLMTAAQLANLAAGVVVRKVGTSTVSPAELVKEAEQGSSSTLLKILDRNELADALSVDRQKDRVIVFTNGCFDLLHAGHVKYLEKAKLQGDVLVVGLNSDASIRRLKGEKRPLIGEEERSHILAALDCVNYVVIFDEDTPLELITHIKPDVLVKGGDYSPEQVVGREFVESNGGRLELIQFVDGKSTSNIINHILESYQDE